MEVRSLNYVEALRLADICAKYFSKDEIGQMTLKGFVYSLLESSSEEEVEFLVGLFSVENEPDSVILKLSSLVASEQILELISYYGQIGGK